MESINNPKEKKYEAERFEFTLYINDDIICNRNFRINNFVEGSMNSLEFKDCIDDIVKMIDDDLKSKSRIYTWMCYDPEVEDENYEFNKPLIEPWECTFKFVVTDNKRVMMSKIWDGYAYPRRVRTNIDLSNKNVKVITKDGQVYTYDKDAYFKSHEGRLSFDQELIKAMIGDKQDVLRKITKRICEACSPYKTDTRPLDVIKGEYTMVADYGDKKYNLSMRDDARKYISEWSKAVMGKTKSYFSRNGE